MDHEHYMELAMEEAQKSTNEGNPPFSVVVVNSSGEVIWKDHDRVKERMDPTAHAEVNAIRHLCSQFKMLSLADYTFYTSSEPCPTCFSALLKAKVGKIYYGAEIETTASLPMKATELAKYATRPIEIHGGILGKECTEQRQRLLSVVSKERSI